MTKKLTKAVLGLAVTAAIGAGAIGANALFVSSAFATNTSQKAPVITSEAAPVETGAGSTATVVKDSNGNQAIIAEQDQSAQDQIANDPVNVQKLKAQKNAKPTFVAGTPSANDLTENKAIEIARKAIVKKYALKAETLAKFSTSAMLNVVDPQAPVWSVTFYPTNQNDFAQIGNYNITIDSLSAKILKIMSAADGVG
jgi:hypothetical protein